MSKNCVINTCEKTTREGKKYVQISIVVNGIELPLNLDYSTRNILLQLIGK